MPYSAPGTSASRFNGRRRSARVLDEDPRFDPHVVGALGDGARLLSRANVIVVAPGGWTPGPETHGASAGMGLLILEGLLLRELGRGARCAGELLGDGDIVDPAAELDGDDPMLGPPRWRALAPTRLAVLDAAWTARMAQYPEALTELSKRSLSRARRSAARMAIAAEPRLDRRIMMLLWELAYRFGTVRSDGVHVALPITHETLSHLVFARRPSVSTVVGRLQSQGLLRRERHGWVLSHGSAPVDDG